MAWGAQGPDTGLLLTLFPWPSATHAQWIPVLLSHHSNILSPLNFMFQFLFPSCKKIPFSLSMFFGHFLLSSVVFLCVSFIFIGRMDQAISHYDNTGPPGPMKSLFVGRGISWCYDKSLWVSLLTQIQSPERGSVLGPDSVLLQHDKWHISPMFLSFHIDFRFSGKCHRVSQVPCFLARIFS